MTNIEIGNRIRNRRLDLGLSLTDVGNYVGVSKSTVCRWETGNVDKIKRSHIYSLAMVLHMPISIILGYEDKEEMESPAVVVKRKVLIAKIEKIKDLQQLNNIETFIEAFITKAK